MNIFGYVVSAVAVFLITWDVTWKVEALPPPTQSGLLGPEQIHISYTGNTSSMYVTWVTNVYYGEGTVHVSPSPVPPNSTYSEWSATTFTVPHYSDDEDINKQIILRESFTFRAIIEGLQENSEYEYYVSNGGALESDKFVFKTFPSNEEFLPTIAVYGDMGLENHVAFDKLLQDANERKYDVVWHIGDIAYDMHELAGARGDMFMNLIQPLAAQIPYSVIPGNHEYRSNFSEYRNKFTSPPPNVFFHSYDIGPIHLIMFNTEFYIFDQFGTDQIQTQYNWLVSDLKSANEVEKRERQPWIVVVGHRPMYCSETDDTDCAPSNPIRIGYKNNTFPLESLFYEYGVDVLIFGHEHNYERMFPIYNYTYQLFDDPNLYQDPIYPVHIISGSAGNREIHSGFRPFEPQWSFMRAKDYGFAYITVTDKFTLDIQQYSVDQSKVIDHFVIKKSNTYPKFGTKLAEKRLQ